jgi:hypothetical protein
MRYLFLILICVVFNYPTKAQEKTTIKVIVPNPDDEVYIVGNQSDLGDWNPSKVKMFKVSDYVRMIAIPFYFPAEFMFTKGSWATEGIIYELDNNPNIYLEDYVKEKVFKIKGWKDEMLKAKYTITYKNEPFESRILKDERKLKVFTPKNYTIEKRYPVIYVPNVDNMFKIAAQHLEIWSEQDYKKFPDCILIGIPFTKDEIESLKSDFLNDSKLKDYIIYDVIPFVNSQFGTSGFNILAGEGHFADFINKLILERNSPVDAAISINPKNKRDISYTLDNYFSNYENDKLFYFLAKPEIEFGLYSTNPLSLEDIDKENIKVKTIDYNTINENLFPLSFNDALNFIFQDFRNLKAYSDFNDFIYNYENKLMNSYNISATYHENEISYFLNDILNKKDEGTYERLLQFIEQKEIITSEGDLVYFDNIDKTKHYFNLGNYEKCIAINEELLSGFEKSNYDRKLAKRFFDNTEYVLTSYGETKKFKAIFDYLDTIIERLPAYILESYYLMAKYSSKYDYLTTRGEFALEYCKKYFHENEVFEEKDLPKITFK